MSKIWELLHDLRGPLKWEKNMTPVLLHFLIEIHTDCRAVSHQHWDIYIYTNNISRLPKQVFMQNLTSSWPQATMGDKGKRKLKCSYHARKESVNDYKLCHNVS